MVRATSKGISKSNAQLSVIIPFVMIPHHFVYLILMPTRRKRSSAKSTTAQRIAAAIDKKPAETSVAKKKPVARKKPVVKEEVVVVSNAVTKEKIDECIKAPTRSLKPVTKYQQPTENKMTETPVKEEVKVINWKEKIQKLDGFSLAILPFLYLEWGVKSALKATGVL